MKRIIGYISILLVGFLYACTNENSGMENASGSLSLRVENDLTLKTKAYSVGLNVLIRDQAQDTVKYIPGYDAATADNILLDAGTYEVIVTSGRADSAAWETPFFYGKENFKITANQITSVEVTCTIANTKVSVDYSDTFKKYFTDYTTKVSNSSGSLVFEKGETRGGFFAAEKLTALLNLTNTDGQQFELKRIISNVEEQTYYKLKFDLNEDSGNNEAGGNFEVSIDEKADTIIITIPIVADDLEKMKVPGFKLEGFDEQNSLVLKAGEAPGNAVKVVIPNLAESLKLTIQSDSLNAQGFRSFDLVNLTASEQALLESIHFPVQPVKDITDTLAFDLKAMADALLPYDDRIQVHTFTFVVMDKMHQEKTLSFNYQVKPNAGVFTSELTAATLWTTFARFTAVTDNETGLGFSYKEAAASEWTEINIASKNADNSFGCLISGLKPHTEYIYRGFCNDDLNGEGRIYGNEVTFTTDFANTKADGTFFVPNLGFEDWCTDGDGIIYPNKDLNSNYFWDSGNGGAKKAKKTPTESESTIVVKGTAAKLHTEMASVMGIGKLAAGNIYSGKYVNTTFSPMGAELDFGRPCTIRPTKLSGFYRYSPGTINEADSPYTHLKNTRDSCHVYVALCKNSDSQTWPFRVVTGNKKFVNLKDKGIIAYGEFYASPASAMTAYQSFSFDIVYRDTESIPTHILIVATSSKYGDYFTGSTSSVLYLDEFELGFDYNPASFAGTALEGLQPANTNN